MNDPVKNKHAAHRTVQQPRHSGEHFRLLFQNMLEGFAYCSVLFDELGRPDDFVYLEVNDSFTRLTGLKDVVGKKVTEVIPGIKDSNPELFEIYGRVASTGRPEKFESHLQSLGIWLAISVYSPSKNDFVAVFDNITERKQAEARLRQSEHRTRATFEKAAIGILEADVAGRFVAVNQSLCQMTGYSREELLKMNVQDITAPEDRAISADRSARLRDGRLERFDYNKRYVRRDGSSLWCHVTASAARDEAGRFLYAIGTVEDITERKRAEEILQETNRRKDDFLAVLSHELRNPLAAIGNSLFLLYQSDSASHGAKQAQAIIKRQFGVLTRLVDDLLDVTRISRGKLQLHLGPVTLNDIVSRTADDHRAQFAAAGIELKVSLPPARLCMRGDATRLVQAIGNLLQNALKFTARGGLVEVSLEANEHGSASIRVRDDGIGIAPEISARVFEPFVQADQGLARTTGGLGLGLALVKTIAEKHGGMAEARSQGLEKGAEFAIHLPLEPIGPAVDPATS